MSKHRFGCPYKIAIINSNKYADSTFCGYSMSLVRCSGRYTYENGNGTAICEVHGTIALPKNFAMDDEEKTIRLKLIGSVGDRRPPTPDYTMARYLPAFMSIDSVPVPTRNLMHGLNNQKVVEWSV